MSSIIGICGFQGSGKDTLAEILINNYGYKKLSFAGAVKDCAAAVFGWNRDMLEGCTKESRIWREQVDEWWSKRLGIPNLTPRYVLQNFGTELFRNHFHQDIWIACIEKQLEKYDKIVITDCRFANEINMIQNNNGIIIKIFRNEISQLYYDVKNGKEPTNIHPSEWKWINSEEDFTIMNNGTIEDLEKNINKLLFHKSIMNTTNC